MVSAEVDPFAKTGGLADMVSALAIQLSKMGHDVKIVMPRYYKIDRAENMGIKVSISIPKDVSKSLLYDLKGNDYKELCKILGVYLDNAIEASIISDDKNIGIEIYNRQDYVSVIISNSYCGEIDEVSINKTGYSTKGSGRGYGLSLVNKIIQSNPIFENETNVTPKLYIQKLTIKKSIND